MRNYYVYAHIFESGEVFYVSKGSGDRLHKQGKGSNLWKSVSNGQPHIAVKLAINLTSNEAYILESQVIRFFKEFGLCRANTSYGGKGVTVPKRWWGDKISESLVGKPAPKGKDSKSFKTFDESTLLEDYESMSSVDLAKKHGVTAPTILGRLKASEKQVRAPGKPATPILCIEDSKLFPSITDAAKFYGVFPANIRKVLNGAYKPTGGKTFKHP